MIKIIKGNLFNSQCDIIINRENLDDLIPHDIIPDRLK